MLYPIELLRLDISHCSMALTMLSRTIALLTSALSGTRTHTEQVLNLLPLPIGLPGLMLDAAHDSGLCTLQYIVAHSSHKPHHQPMTPLHVTLWHMNLDHVLYPHRVITPVFNAVERTCI